MNTMIVEGDGVGCKRREREKERKRSSRSGRGKEKTELAQVSYGPELLGLLCSVGDGAMAG